MEEFYNLGAQYKYLVLGEYVFKKLSQEEIEELKKAENRCFCGDYAKEAASAFGEKVELPVKSDMSPREKAMEARAPPGLKRTDNQIVDWHPEDLNAHIEELRKGVVNADLVKTSGMHFNPGEIAANLAERRYEEYLEGVQHCNPGEIAANLAERRYEEYLERVQRKESYRHEWKTASEIRREEIRREIDPLAGTCFDLTKK